MPWQKSCCQINKFLQFKINNWCRSVNLWRDDLTEAKKQRSLFGVRYKSTEMSFCKLKTNEKIFPLTYTVIEKHHILKSSGIKVHLPPFGRPCLMVWTYCVWRILCGQQRLTRAHHNTSYASFAKQTDHNVENIFFTNHHYGATVSIFRE